MYICIYVYVYYVSVSVYVYVYVYMYMYIFIFIWCFHILLTAGSDLNTVTRAPSKAAVRAHSHARGEVLAGWWF